MPVKIIALLEPALLFMALSPAGSDCRLRSPNHSLGPLHHTARSRQLPGHPSSHGQSGGDGSRQGEPRGEAAPRAQKGREGLPEHPEEGCEDGEGSEGDV